MASLLNIVSPYMHPSMLYKLKSALFNPSNRKKIEVTDLEEKTTINYDSIREAARALDIQWEAIKNYLANNQKKPYKGRYTLVGEALTVYIIIILFSFARAQFLIEFSFTFLCVRNDCTQF